MLVLSCKFKLRGISSALPEDAVFAPESWGVAAGAVVFAGEALSVLFAGAVINSFRLISWEESEKLPFNVSFFMMYGR